MGGGRLNKDRGVRARIHTSRGFFLTNVFSPSFAAPSFSWPTSSPSPPLPALFPSAADASSAHFSVSLLFSMGSDSAVATPSAFVRDAGKKKRTNRSAKLKQCKLDARREQWLSQVKKKGDKESANGCLATSSIPLPVGGGGQGGNVRLSHSCPTPRPPAGDNEVVVLQDSDSESLTPIRTNCCPEKDRHTSSGSSSSGSYSGNATEEDEEEEDSLDDWEAIADALNSESQAELESPSPDPVAVTERASLPPRVRARPEMIPKPAANPRAWRPDDQFRPQSLPNLAKQRSFPSNLDRRYGHAAGKWTNIGMISTPSSCPICYEDLDLTDSSFLPCSCGFRLCLFCHKRILEEADGRCPGCRSPYSPVQEEVAVNIAPSHCRLLRSCSMSIRY